MTDQRKPFAETQPCDWNPTNSHEGYSRMVVGGVEVGSAVRDLAEEWAREINAAVDQREARLVGALRKMVELTERTPLIQLDHRTKLGRAHKEACAALEGHGDYVPIAELEAERAKVKALQAALDVLDATETMTADVVRAYLEAAGLRGHGAG